MKSCKELEYEIKENQNEIHKLKKDIRRLENLEKELQKNISYLESFEKKLERTQFSVQGVCLFAMIFFLGKVIYYVILLK